MHTSGRRTRSCLGGAATRLMGAENMLGAEPQEPRLWAATTYEPSNCHNCHTIVSVPRRRYSGKEPLGTRRL